ncbi:hypothetical protein, partial [Paraglaciecola arctica]|uniref:hypothetical protein n=1 Tax=Paraglaciecola arctica TaxID=1128911 RepID=UPI001C068DEF
TTPKWLWTLYLFMFNEVEHGRDTLLNRKNVVLLTMYLLAKVKAGERRKVEKIKHKVCIE